MQPTQYRVIISTRAFQNLDQILDYVKTVSPQAAMRTIDELLAGCQSLEAFPHRYTIVGTRGKRIREETRMMPIDPYLVYYRVVEHQKVVRVITVRHAKRRRLRRI